MAERLAFGKAERNGRRKNEIETAIMLRCANGLLPNASAIWTSTSEFMSFAEGGRCL
jgi:hypothetical protein